jgi:GntR family transcriptional regulator / MocR family aminotransferase
VRRAKIERNNKAIQMANSPFELIRLELDHQSQTPIYRQIYDRFRDAMMRRVLRPGERLPSARTLASQLATSRGTVDLAYGLLSSEGFILSQGAAGTIVGPGIDGFLKPAPAGLPREREASTVAPFTMGLPALDAFPRKLWTRLSARRARELTIGAMAAQDGAGYAPLCEAIASYLALSRGVLCSAKQVIITGGFQSALGIITRAFLQPGDEVWLEDPGYFMVPVAFRAAGAKVVGVPVDAEGLDVAAGIAQASRARFAYVTPSHQAPMGVSLSRARRQALLSWAADTGAWIIEDDYDSEFRYGSRPLPALRSVDHSGRVLYVGSFSKVLFPGLRLGYLVVPEPEIGRLDRIYQAFYRDRPVLNQAIVTDFMTQGHFARHIKRMRKLYEGRRAALAAALLEVFEGRIDLQLQGGGMHLLARFPGCESDVDLAERATARGLFPNPLSLWRVDHDCGQGLLLGFTNIPQETAFRVALRLREAIGI